MNPHKNLHRIPSLLAAAAVAITFTACGDDTVDQGSAPTLPDISVAPPDTPGDTTPGTSPGDDVPVGYDHPTASDEVVFEYAELGGFVTRDWAFQRTPSVMISGDGRVFGPGAQLAIYPGPLVPAVQVQTISEAGIQALLAAADEAGLFADIDYETNSMVADATTATVTIRVDGETYVHEAYALGLGLPGEGTTESTPEREALAQFVAQLGDLTSLVGADELGEPEIYQPEQYQIEAIVVDDLSAYGGDIEPTVVEWPVDASVRLADAVTSPGGEGPYCTAVPAAEFGDLFTSANQLTFFDDGDVIYQVLVRPALPGDDCTS